MLKPKPKERSLLKVTIPNLAPAARRRRVQPPQARRLNHFRIWAKAKREKQKAKKPKKTNPKRRKNV